MAINYTKVNNGNDWDGVTPLNEANLQHLEQGVKDACDAIDKGGQERFQVSGNAGESSTLNDINSIANLQYIRIILPVGKSLVLKRARWYFSDYLRLQVETNEGNTWVSSSSKNEVAPNFTLATNSSAGNKDYNLIIRAYNPDYATTTRYTWVYDGWWLDLAIE